LEPGSAYAHYLPFKTAAKGLLWVHSDRFAPGFPITPTKNFPALSPQRLATKIEQRARAGCYRHREISHKGVCPPVNQRMTSSRRIEANRANSQHSTGPNTETGKAVSKLNAVRTALTGRTVLLSSDDVSSYEQHIQNWTLELHPVGPRESALVQSIADSHWRTDRIARLEFALYAQGSEQSADGGQSELETYLAYEKQLRNLAIQESRIRRGREKDLAELKALQATRRESEAAEHAASIPDQPLKSDKNHTGVGFEFSSSGQAADQASGQTSQPATNRVTEAEQSGVKSLLLAA
jgi:hypothetical protein